MFSQKKMFVFVSVRHTNLMMQTMRKCLEVKGKKNKDLWKSKRKIIA